jgi:NAD+ synthase (glutamine-hydrolysing)
MKLIKVAAGVVNQTPLAWDENKRNILAAIEQARLQDVSILCLPELCITGYGCEDAFQSRGVQRQALDLLEEIIPHTSGIVVSLGLPAWHAGGLFNTACLLANGENLGFVAKQNLAGDGLHYEPRWFKAWQAGVVSSIEVGEKSYPLGDLVFDLDGIRLGFEICEDAWVADRSGTRLAQRGVDIILNPSASHFAFGKQDVRRRFVLEGSRALQVSYIYANLLGNEAGRAIYDGDAMVASDGEMLAVGPRLTFHDLQLTSAVIDIQRTRASRERDGSYQPSMDEEGVVTAHFDFPDCEQQLVSSDAADWESGDSHKQEEFARAVSLGLFDYLRKSHSRGFVVSLSGGADSATVATLCKLMVDFAWHQLGPAGLQEKLSYLASDPVPSSPRDWTHRLLACVYQSTRNSSETTRAAAASLAATLGAEYYEFDVDALVQGYVETVEGAIGRDLSWQADDIALQNIQARARAPGVWLLANLRGALLLATSNRSEAAVGYTTMDGDTCGGISPIAGIDKAFLRTWLEWMEEEGPEGTEGIPELSAINEQQPTAELRPPEQGQTDESDLMPYAVLDAIERLAIRDKLTPVEIYQSMVGEHDRIQLAAWIRRFFQLWARNQWKRERYAPSFHLDDENLDPKTWCRFPILSGGFKRELEELEKLVQSEGQ